MLWLGGLGAKNERLLHQAGVRGGGLLPAAGAARMLGRPVFTSANRN